MNISIDNNPNAMVSFLKRNNSSIEQVSATVADLWYIAHDDYQTFGTCGILKYSNSIRIKSFFIRKDKRNEGIGAMLIEKVITDFDVQITAFATKFSRPIFEKYGFVVESEKKNDIAFMRRSV
ncbi:MAG: GNAT family N-acetyltransferase [Deferribacteraceae bacterium]|jgi:N-acetylglutamate synthase-like GNAT family acetyltransferase|nr:GNAT family N-acetyltransferase [Deferribacteraceae bacterium]